MIEIEKGTSNNYTSVIRIDKDKGIVEKVIDYEPYSLELFDRELYWLNKLRGSGIVPKVISSDKEKKTITMEWCGEILSEFNKPDDVFEQLFDISITLLKHDCFYNDWKWGNFLVKNDKVYIIDFGWCPLIKEDYSCNNWVDTDLVRKPAGNYFQELFDREVEMEEVKLLDLNNDWQQAQPGYQKFNDHWDITGYQSYRISKRGITALSNNTVLKHALVKDKIRHDVMTKKVSDIGCANMFFGFLSHFCGAKSVTGVDLDKRYIEQNKKIIDEFMLPNVQIKEMNVVDYKEPSDVVFAFAIIHWIYSCSGFLGSLSKVVKHFRSITNECLYIEWIDPSDDCIADMLHHLDFNKDLTVKDFNKENFLKYLNEHFSAVEFLGSSKATREIYRCLV